MQKLKEEFEQNGGSWKEFKIGDVFKVETTKKKFNAFNVKFGGKYPYVVRTALNNGVKGLIMEDEKFLNPARTISFGQDTATMFYQEQPYFTGDKIKILTLKAHDLTNKIACFLISIMGKAFKNFKWGQSSFNEKVLNNVRVKLPVTLDSQIDFDYMERYISELEEERISELEEERINELAAYLKVTGLENCVLTKPEKLALKSRVGRGNLHKFRIGDLFEGKTGDTDLQQKDVNNRGHPFINSGVQNLGIKGRTDRLARIFPKNTITIDFWGNAYYRDFEYKLATHNHVFSLSGNLIRNEKVGLYLSATMSYMPHFFSYNNMGTWNKIKEHYISLPATKTGDPDYEFMETYIRALEKVIIKGVVDWKDRIIKTTRDIVYNK